MPTQIQLETVKMVEIEPESDVPGPAAAARNDLEAAALIRPVLGD